MNRAFALAFGLLLLALVGAQAADEAGWITLFNGKDLTGWETRKTPDGTGGKWEVQDGVLCGTQDPPGNGGYLFSKESFGDFELKAEINPDFGLDSGIFFRCPPNYVGYQITIDYRPGGQTGTLYCGGWLQENPQWEQFYKKDTWNELRIVCQGSPPHIQAWLNGNQTVDFTDTKADREPREGPLALQLHGGGSWAGKWTRFKTIKIKRLQ